MRKSLIYTNSANEKIDFTEIAIIQSEADIFSHQWEQEILYNKLIGFKKGIHTIPIPICIHGQDANAQMDNILGIIEKDVISNSPGVLQYGDWKIPGYFFAKKTTRYIKNSNVIEFTLSFVTDQKCWIREQAYTYRLNDLKVAERGLGYAYDYPYDFLSSINAQNLYNTALVDSNFKLTVYGPAVNPAVSIAGNVYQVNTKLLPNEYLTIDSLKKTITRTTSKGVKINEYAKRSLENYIFKKIPVGLNPVSVVPNCNFDVVVVEERSEPKWT